MKKTIQEQIEIMQHYANGGEVEYIHKSSSKEEWILKVNKDIAFNWEYKDYRIKEQKKTITIEKWLHEDGRCIEIEKGKLQVRAGSVIIGSYEAEL